MKNIKIDRISEINRQFELFDSTINTATNFSHLNNLKVNSENLILWRNKIYNYQSKIAVDKINKSSQKSIFPDLDHFDNKRINPFILQPLSLNFWRANQSVHDGPAMYFVVDTMKSSKIILYIGETNSANKRWKGEHDCKNYLSNYSDSLQKANISTKLSIRFWLDVPTKTKERRKLEQKLIQTWLPPFNKETREIWATPFTSQIN